MDFRESKLLAKDVWFFNYLSFRPFDGLAWIFVYVCSFGVIQYHRGASEINSKQLGIRQSSIFSIGRWAFSWPLSNTWNFEEEKYYQLIDWLYVFSIYYLSSNWLTFEVIKSSMSVGGVSYNILFHTWPCLVRYSTHLFGRVNEGLALPQRCSGLVPTLT